MGVAQHIQIRTRKGYARVTLNQGKLLITYYVHHLAVDWAVFSMQDQEYIYQDGWNLNNLRRVVRLCEHNKTNDKAKVRWNYHE